MIEINVRMKIDTNDPREAYLQMMGALSFSGHKFDVSDYWIINGRPMPKQIARTVRQCRGVRIVTHCVTIDEPRPRCIHSEVDFDVSEDETPMFQAMVSKQIDFLVGPPWMDLRPSQRDLTYLDFDIGTAETTPLSAIDVEIYNLMNCLDAPASVPFDRRLRREVNA